MKRQPSKKAEVEHEMSPVLALLNDDGDIREAYKNLPRGQKEKAAVFLSSMWGVMETAKKIGVDVQAVRNYRHTLKHYRMELKAVRAAVLEEVYKQKAFQIAVGIKPENITDDKKAQSVKALMDASDIARVHGQPTGGGNEEEETVELFYRVRRKLKTAGGRGDEDDGGEDEDEQGGGVAIDVTADVEVNAADTG
jgi:hypothetical protein